MGLNWIHFAYLNLVRSNHENFIDAFFPHPLSFFPPPFYEDPSSFQKSTRHVPYGFHGGSDSDSSLSSPSSSSPPSIVVFGLLGDECLLDSDCRGVEGEGAAACRAGRCRCADPNARPADSGDRCIRTGEVEVKFRTFFPPFKRVSYSLPFPASISWSESHLSPVF